MLSAAKRFLATLDDPARSKALLPFASEERFNWHFVPKERAGLPYKQMTDAQQRAARDLLRASLSQPGFEKVSTIRRLEDTLREIEKGAGPIRDTELFYFTVFGEPSERGPWAWRYEGHHVSLHWTMIDGRVIASTPQFLGSNPAEVREGPLKGTRVLRVEEDLGRELVRSLTPEQRAQAVLSDRAPADILTSNQRKAAIQDDLGIAYSALTPSQQGVLQTLIQEYAAVQRPEVARARLERLRAAGMERIKFAWMGGLEKGQGHYYRIQGPTFLIEYDNTQNNANHIHTVWRDFQGDFGLDLLAEHYRAHRHVEGGSGHADH